MPVAYPRRPKDWCYIVILFALAWILLVNFAAYSFWCDNSINTRDLDILQQKLRQLHEDIKGKEQKFKEVGSFNKKLRDQLTRLENNMKRRFPKGAKSLLESQHKDLELPIIYAITPTHTRPTQKAELTRLSQTFLHVTNFHWIVVEDAENRTKLVTKLLARSGIQYTHLNILTPPAYKLAHKDPNWLKPRGVLQRNLALKWMRENLDRDSSMGVIYFADDDNTYDLKIFEEMRYTKKVSIWPVGLVGHLRYESPVVKDGKVVGWFTYWKPHRPFPMDMAGFAINLQLMFDHPKAQFKLEVPRGYLESSLLTDLSLTLPDLEPKADNCSKIYVWHTRTEKADLRNEKKLQLKGRPPSDPNMEV